MRPAVLVSLLLVFGCSPPDAPPAATSGLAPHADLSDSMLKMQVHAAKLALAAEADNWELARFYVEQIDEDVQPLAAGRVTVGTTNISEIAATLFPPLLTRLREAALDRDAAAFDAAYLDLIQGCNSCHRSAGHAYIVIERPRGAFPGNQRF